MEQNKSSKLNTVLLVVLIVLVIFGFYMMSNKKESQPMNETPTGQTEVNANSNAIETYINSQYGFSFQYPDDWKLSEDKNKNQVTISTKAMYSQGSMYTVPVESITFKATDKTFFNPPIGTKVGMISYDESKSALTDGEQCLKPRKLLGDFNGSNTTSIQAIYYGGSLMADPAYSDSAILTKNGLIVVVHTEQGDALTPDITSQMATIASSFKLLNENTVFIPACAQ